MKMFRKMLCALLVATMLCASAVPAFAATAYMRGADNGWASIDIAGCEYGSKITDVKSSNKAIANLSSLFQNNHINYYFETKESNKNGYASIDLHLRKPGKTTISYKLNGKAKKVVLNVLKYVNPLKSFKITGLGSANLKSQFSKQSYAERELKSNVKAGAVQVTAASGWKITRVEFEDDVTGKYYSFSSWRNGVNAATLKIPAMKGGTVEGYSVYVSLRNVKNDAQLDLNYRMH